MFDFTCRSCGERFEKLFRRVTEKPAADCPKCGSEKTERALSLVNAGGSKASTAETPPPTCGRCGIPGGGCGMH
jgi:putative FmdB family regulatory protein